VAKTDYIGDCNNHGVPLEDFRLTFCERCIREDCSRSMLSQGGHMEERAAHWHERLFTDVPRMDADDPRFKGIAAQKFMAIPVGATPEVGGQDWVDPRELREPEPVPVPQAIEPPQPAPEPEPEAVPEPVAAPRPPTPEPPLQLEPPPPPEPVEKTTSEPAPMQVLQTEGGTGRMIGGAKPPEKKSDPWEPAGVSSKGTDKIVAPGAKIKLGSSQ